MWCDAFLLERLRNFSCERRTFVRGLHAANVVHCTSPSSFIVGCSQCLKIELEDLVQELSRHKQVVRVWRLRQVDALFVHTQAQLEDFVSLLRETGSICLCVLSHRDLAIQSELRGTTGGVHGYHIPYFPLVCLNWTSLYQFHVPRAWCGNPSLADGRERGEQNYYTSVLVGRLDRNQHHLAQTACRENMILTCPVTLCDSLFFGTLWTVPGHCVLQKLFSKWYSRKKTNLSRLGQVLGWSRPAPAGAALVLRRLCSGGGNEPPQPVTLALFDL